MRTRKCKKDNFGKLICLLLFILLIVQINNLIKLNKNNEPKKKELSDLEKEYTVQSEKVNKFKSELDEFSKTGIMKDDKTNFVYLSNVPIIDQFPEFPTGCESIALLILLKNYGMDLNGYDIINNLKREELPKYINGIYKGGNPEFGFLGDPTKIYGGGVYEGPIIDVANKYKSGIVNVTGKDLNDILKIIDLGSPVQVWVTLDVRSTNYSKSWIDITTGKKIYWPNEFHSLVITGYDDTHIYTSDPDTGTSRAFDRTQFEKVYNFQGKRAIYYEN